MKILHTADWHLGKNLHGASLIEEQKHALQQIIEIAQAEDVDAIIIAGDLYDKPIPTIEATELLEATLYTLNVEMELPVLAISGNHDSATRLAFGNAWYEKNQLHVSGGLRGDIEVITLDQIQFWLVPYHDVQTARYALDDTSLKNVDEAMRAIVERIKERADITKKQVLIGHAFVAGGLMSDSERSLSVGNVERVSIPTFDFFDYVALGHLHNPNALQEERVRYSGSPVKYSFSESTQEKMVRVIDIEQNVRVKNIPLTPLRDVRIIQGTLQDLIQEPQEPVEDYIKVELLDEGTLIDPMGKLKQVYPNILHLERKTHELKELTREDFATMSKKEEADVFAQFFAFVNGKDMTATQQAIVEEVITEIKRGED